MRYVRIILLHLEHVLQNRGRLFVWFLIALLNPLIYLLFWRANLAENGGNYQGWNLSSIASYYFLIIIASSFLEVHIEEDVAYIDIQEGALVRYLVKPFSYFGSKFFEELPWRVVQGLCGVGIFILFQFFSRGLLKLANTPMTIVLAVLVILLGYLISYTFKMIMGLTALWLTDYRGLQNLLEVVFFIFAGILMPIDLYPSTLRLISTSLPFAYIIYFPVGAIQGKFLVPTLAQILLIQLIWLFCLYLVYHVIWIRGIRRFSGVGQ